MGVISVNSKRIPALDGIRGLAVLSVICFHYFYWCLPQNLRDAHLSFFSFLSIGWAGVNLFFVLSGFLITSLLLEARGAKHYYRDFYLRRALRLLPALWLTFVFMLALDVKSAGCIGLTALFIPNFATSLGVSCEVNGSLWSLGVEEQFYIGWSILVAALSLRSLKVATLALCLGVPLVRYFFATPLFVAFTPFRLDSLGWGALFAMALHTRTYWTPKRVAIGSLIFSVAVAAFSYRFGGLSRNTQAGLAFQFVTLDLFCLSLIAAAVANLQWVNWLLSAPFLRFAGRRSYCAYLVHLPIMSLVNRLLVNSVGESWATSPQSGGYLVLLLLASFLGTFLFAELSGRFVEEPILRFKSLMAPPVKRSKKSSKIAA